MLVKWFPNYEKMTAVREVVEGITTKKLENEGDDMKRLRDITAMY